MELGSHSSHISRADLTANIRVYFVFQCNQGCEFEISEAQRGRGQYWLETPASSIDCDVLTCQSCRADVTDMVNRKQSVKR